MPGAINKGCCEFMAAAGIKTVEGALAVIEKGAMRIGENTA